MKSTPDNKEMQLPRGGEGCARLRARIFPKRPLQLISVLGVLEAMERPMRWSMVGVALITQIACCPQREMGTVTDVSGTVECCAAVNSYIVTSPRHSNLIIILTWGDPTADLSLRVTEVGCTGLCEVRSNNPLGTTTEELHVDGTRGKQWNVAVVGDARKAQQFRLLVTYDTGTCT